MVKELAAKTSVAGMVTQIQKERRRFDSKARDIHARAAEMLRDGQENMTKGIKAVAAKIPPFEREINAKAKDIHMRAKEMTAEGEKRMSAGIKAVEEGIKEQIHENNAAVKEMGNGVKAIENKIEKMKEHIRGHARETTRYIHAFYYGE